MPNALESRLLSLKKKWARAYWLINANKSRVKRFIENAKNKDQFLNIFIDSGKVITSTCGKNPPVISAREELKKDAA